MSITQTIIEFIRKAEAAGFRPTSIGIGKKGMDRLIWEFDQTRLRPKETVGDLSHVEVMGVPITL
jgi:hypothetical protein